MPCARYPRLNLRTILIVPFVLQIVSAVGLVGWLSYLNGQQAVNDLVAQLQTSTAKRIEQHLRSFLDNSRTLNRVHAVNVETEKLNPDNFADLQNYFWHILKTQKQSNYFIYANREGNYLGVDRIEDDRFVVKVRDGDTQGNRITYRLNERGQRQGAPLESIPFDPRQRPFFRAALERAEWTPIYLSFSRKVLRFDAIEPIYDAKGVFRGVFSTEVTLSQISDFLDHLSISRSGETFIVDRTGNLVASSTGEIPFRRVNGEEKRLAAIDSQQPLIRETSREILRRFPDFTREHPEKYFFFWRNGQKQLAYIQPFGDGRGIDWSIVVVVPEADFMDSIDRNTHNSILLSLGALGTAIAIGIITARRVTRPLLRVGQASEKIARGDLDQQIAPSSIVEIDRLATSFTLMAGQLQESFTRLEEKEERFRTLAANIPGITYRCLADRDWTMAYISDVVAEVTGYPASDFIDGVRTFASIIHPEDAERVAAEIAAAVASDRPYILEYRLLHRDGSIRWMDERGRGCFNDDGKMIFLDGAMFDITDQKLAAESLRIMEERFRTLAANIPGITYRCLCDADWTMAYISDVVEEVTGYPASDFIDGVRTFASIIHPEDSDRLVKEIDESVSEDRPYILEYRLIRRDGSIRWMDERGRACFDEEGKVLFLDGAMFDITATKLAEESLRLAEEKYRGIFENALEGIFQSSPDGRLLSVNPSMARIFGYDSPEEMIASIADIRSSIYVDGSDRLHLNALLEEGGQVNDFEFRAYQRDGEIIWVEIDVRSVRNLQGNILFYEGIIQEITDRIRREEALKRQLEALKIEIDQQKRQKEVASITQSNYFQEIQDELERVDLDEFWS
jgi:PAS domain S-box-containing protein